MVNRVAQSTGANLRALDVLRGFLVIFVVLHHARWLLWAGHAAWIQNTHSFVANFAEQAFAVFRYGHEAVLVFFALSGFFIHLRMAQSLELGMVGEFSASKYYRRRLHRLVAPYFFALLVTIACDLAGRLIYPDLYSGHTGDSLLDENFLRKDFSWSAVLPALAILPRSLGKDFGSNGPLWSLGYEMLYYALYPVWLSLRRRNVAVAYLLVPGACLLLAGSHVLGSHFGDVVRLYPIWLGGALLAEQCVRPRSGSVMLVAAATTLALGGAVWRWSPMEGAALMWVVGAGSVVFGFAAWPAKWMDRAGSRLLEWVGVRSYSIYILHFPLLVLLCAVGFRQWGERPLGFGYFVMGSVVTIALSLGGFRCCEHFFLHPRLKMRNVACPPSDSAQSSGNQLPTER